MAAQALPLPGWLGGIVPALARRPRWLLIVGALLIVAALAIGISALRSTATMSYITQPVAQQTLVQSVSASGTVNPQNTIDVGTQVSGTISGLYVDFNSKVKKGQVLARLDPTTFNAQLNQAQAALAQSQAQAAAAGSNAQGASSGISVASANSAAAASAVASAQANIGKAQSALALAQQTQSRDAQLLAQGFVAQNQVDADSATVAQDTSDVVAARAAYAQAQSQAAGLAAQVNVVSSQSSGSSSSAAAAAAAVQSAQAVVAQDQYNVQRTVITSPVNGTVVARDVSLGQTVAASLQTPTLFAIAQDLTKMQVDINVAEPDIGNVKPGDLVNFSVLAYPGRTFVGNVAQVRINPQTVNNVVTYDVVVNVNNTGDALLPGMTANATIDIARAANALVVPLAALQWQPAARKSGAAGGTATASSAWGSVNGTASSAMSAGSQGVLYVENGRKIARVAVTIALLTSTQAAVTPVQVGALSVGDPVVVGTATGKVKTATVTHSPLSGGGHYPHPGGG